MNCPECGADLEISSLYGDPPAVLECRSCGARLSWDRSTNTYGGGAAAEAPAAASDPAGERESKISESPTSAIGVPPASKPDGPVSPPDQDLADALGAGTSPIHLPPLGSPAVEQPVEEKENLLGQTIGGCEIQEFIGRGGMGAVYKARQISLDRPVAFKVVSEAAQRDESFLRRFEREAKTIAKFNSSRIVQVYEVGFDQGVHFITMEYVSGGDLKTRTRKLGRIPPDDALIYLRQAAEGLLAAERQKIIHRDLKPENLMMDAGGEIKITDFGLAKTLQTDFTLTQMGDYLGTPVYMSPEQSQGLPLDHRSDMYSLGATFFYLLTGNTPYTGETIYEILRKKTEFECLDPSQALEKKAVPEGLCNVIRRMTAQKAEDRYPSFQDLINEIDQIMRGMPTMRYRFKRKKRYGVKLLVTAAILAALYLVGSQFIGLDKNFIPYWKEASTPPIISGGGGKTQNLEVEKFKQSYTSLISSYDAQAPSIEWVKTAEKFKTDSILFANLLQEERSDVDAKIQETLENLARGHEREFQDLQERVKKGLTLSLVKEVRAFRENVQETSSNTKFPDIQKKLVGLLKSSDEVIENGLKARIAGSNTKMEDLEKQLQAGPISILVDQAETLQKEATELRTVVMESSKEGSARDQLNGLISRLEGFMQHVRTGLGIQERLGRLPRIEIAIPLESLPSDVKVRQGLFTPQEEWGDALKGWLASEKKKQLGGLEKDVEEAVKSYLLNTKEGADDFPARVNTLEKAKENLLAAFPGLWERVVPENTLETFKSRLQMRESQDQELREIVQVVAGLEKMIPDPKMANKWTSTLEKKIQGEIQGAKTRLQGISREGPEEILKSLQALDRRVVDLEQQVLRWSGYSRGFQQALMKFEEHRLKVALAEVEKLAEYNLSEPRLEHLRAACQEMAKGFDSLFRNLNLEAAGESFQKAREASEKGGLGAGVSYSAQCLERLSGLRALSANMAPVPSGRVKTDENAASQAVEGFFIDRYETSVEEYRKFLEELKNVKSFDEVKEFWPSQAIFERDRNEPPYLSIESNIDPRWPIEEVDYYQARAYLLSRKRDLFTLEEWWLAAKGNLDDGPHSEFPCLRSDITTRRKPVGEGCAALSFRLQNSVHHLSGNVAEWVLAEKGAKRSRLIGGSYRDTEDKYFSGEQPIFLDLTEANRGYGFRGVVRPKAFFAGLEPRE